MEQAVNSFNKGLNLDVNPMLLSNDSLSDCLNGTLITQNGNELILQNDMGNVKIDKACLPNGYEPVGIKEHGGIIYVACYNPITNKSLIGSFPSPEHIIDKHDGLEPVTIELDLLDNIYISETFKFLKSNSKLIPILKDDSLHIGDKFNLESNNLWNNDNDSKLLLSNFNSDNFKNKQYTLSAGVLNSQNEFVDITKDLVRWNGNNLINTSDMTDEEKFNSGYYISSTRSSEISVDFDNYRKEAVNTYKYKLVGPLYFKLNLNRITDFLYRVNVLKSTEDSGGSAVDYYYITFTGIVTTNMPEDLSNITDLTKVGFTLASLQPISRLNDLVHTIAANSRIDPFIDEDDPNYVPTPTPTPITDTMSIKLDRIEEYADSEIKLTDLTENNVSVYSDSNSLYVIDNNLKYQLTYSIDDTKVYDVLGSEILAKGAFNSFYSIETPIRCERSEDIDGNIQIVTIKKTYKLSNIPNNNFSYKLLVPVNVNTNTDIYQEDLCINNTIDLSLAESNIIDITSWKWKGINVDTNNDNNVDYLFQTSFAYNRFLSQDLNIEHIYAELTDLSTYEKLPKVTATLNNDETGTFTFNNLTDLHIYSVRLSYDFSANNNSSVEVPGEKYIDYEEFIVYSNCVGDMISNGGLETHGEDITIDIPCNYTINIGNAQISSNTTRPVLNKIRYSTNIYDFSDMSDESYDRPIQFSLKVNKSASLNDANDYPNDVDSKNINYNLSIENNNPLTDENIYYSNDTILYSAYKLYELGWKNVTYEGNVLSCSTNCKFSTDINDFISKVKIYDGGSYYNDTNDRIFIYNSNHTELVDSLTRYRIDTIGINTSPCESEIIDSVYKENHAQTPSNIIYTYDASNRLLSSSGMVSLNSDFDRIIWISNSSHNRYYPYLGTVKSLFLKIFRKMAGGDNYAFALPQNEEYNICVRCLEINNNPQISVNLELTSTISGKQLSLFKRLSYNFTGSSGVLEKVVNIAQLNISEPQDYIVFDNNKKYVYISPREVLELRSDSPILINTGLGVYWVYDIYRSDANNPFFFHINDDINNPYCYMDLTGVLKIEENKYLLQSSYWLYNLEEITIDPTYVETITTHTIYPVFKNMIYYIITNSYTLDLDKISYYNNING